MTDPRYDPAMISASAKVTQAGGATAVAGWLTSSEVAAVVGIVVAVVGLAVNWWYLHRRDRREAAVHAALMRDMRGDE